MNRKESRRIQFSTKWRDENNRKATQRKCVHSHHRYHEQFLPYPSDMTNHERIIGRKERREKSYA